jgi:nucleoside-diphosphate-sugar epimerase
VTSVGSIIDRAAPVLVTGATGFLGSRVVARLLAQGHTNIRCLARPARDLGKLEDVAGSASGSSLHVLRGNLMSRSDCVQAARDVTVIYHLAAGTGQKSFPEAFMNSVVTTRNLLDAALQHKTIKRFVNVSSFAVYTNRDKPRGRLLDESCPVDVHPHLRGEAYAYAKVKQDELVIEYGKQHGVPYVLVRPGSVYGPGVHGLSWRVGTGTFGVFLHMGGSNVIPFTYVDNCAEAIVLAGLRPGIDGEVLNVVDDDLPTSREFLRLYKRQVGPMASIPVPRPVSYLLCWLWERYSASSGGQLPPAFNRRVWHAYWKGSRYSNEKLKRLVGWAPLVTTAEGLDRYFASYRQGARAHA